MLEQSLFQNLGSVVPMLLIFVLLAFLPFIFLSVTSFLKINIVFNILRSALGVQQFPSTVMISLVSFVLTLFVMRPTLLEVKEAIEPELKTIDAREINFYGLSELSNKAVLPVRRFLEKNTDLEERVYFASLSKECETASLCISEHETIFSLVPSFVFCELKRAFRIGFLIFIPFLIVDIFVSTLLMSMGMMMVSPVVFSLPLKILLFIVCDGWLLLSQNLISTYN